MPRITKIKLRADTAANWATADAAAGGAAIAAGETVMVDNDIVKGDGTTAAVSLARVGSNTYAGAMFPAAAIAAGSKGRYSPDRSAYAIGSSLRSIRTALGNTIVGAGYARINIVGDSMVDGATPGGQLWKNGFAGRLRDALSADFGCGGTGVIHMITGSWTSDDRFVSTGSWTHSSLGAFVYS